jgi:hypothetical protein
MRMCLLMCLAVGFADDPAAELVRRLGSSTFAVRENAARELACLGRSAETALRAGLDNADPEVRQRCRSLLDNALHKDRTAKLQAFLDGKDDPKNPLSGWPRFARLAGSAAAARASFAALYRADAEVLETADRSAREAAALFAARAAQLGPDLLTPDRDEAAIRDAALLLLLALDDRLVLDATAVTALGNSLEILSHREALRKAFLKDPAWRGLLLGFLRQRLVGASQERGLELAGAFGLTEAVDWALEVAVDKTAPGSRRGRALWTLAQVGSRQQVPRLEPLLSDDQAVGDRPLGNSTLHAQVRDVALGSIIRLSGAELGDFGFPYLQAVPGFKMLPSPACLGFATDAERQKVFQAWKDRGVRSKK